MAWDEKRKSHDGLIAAGYRGPREADSQYPAECRFCKKAITWYITPNGKFQPFTADTFIPHHGDCPQYAQMRKDQKSAGKPA